MIEGKTLYDLLYYIFTVYFKQGNGFTALIIISASIAVVIFGFKFLKAKGFFETPMDRNIGKIYQLIYDLKLHSSQSSINLLNAVEIIAQKQNSHLTNDQVSIIIQLTFEYLQKDISIKILEIKDINTIVSVADLEMYFEIAIRETDRKFFSLPNTKGAVVDTETKLTNLKKDGIYENIIDIINNSDSDIVIVKKCSQLILSCMDTWYLRV